MATASLIKANNPFLVTWKPSFSRGLPSHKSVPNNLCFIKPAKFTGLSVNYSNSKKATHRAASASPFNFDGRSPKKNYFQLAYCAILQTLKTLKNRTVSFVLLVWLSMKQFDDEISKLAKRSVLKIQVGFLAKEGPFIRDLLQITETVRASKRGGHMLVVEGVTQPLLQYSDYFFCAHSSVNVDDVENLKKNYELMCNEEQRNFGKETLPDVDMMKIKSMINQKAEESSYVPFAIKIVVAAVGVHKQPVINSREDLKEALQKLCSLRWWQVLGVRVFLRGPQSENGRTIGVVNK